MPGCRGGPGDGGAGVDAVDRQDHQEDLQGEADQHIELAVVHGGQWAGALLGLGGPEALEVKAEHHRPDPEDDAQAQGAQTEVAAAAGAGREDVPADRPQDAQGVGEDLDQLADVLGLGGERPQEAPGPAVEQQQRAQRQEPVDGPADEPVREAVGLGEVGQRLAEQIDLIAGQQVAL